MAYFYVGCPYTGPQEIMHERFLLAERYVANALRAGHHVYSPIVHCHELARKYNLPTDAAFWEQYNFAMLAPSQGLEVLHLPGWKDSRGLAGERRFATAWDIPIIHIGHEHPWLRTPVEP